MGMNQSCTNLVLGFVVCLLPSWLRAEPVAVRFPQGSAHGFVELRTLEGKRLAVGDMIQNVRGDRVTSRLAFHFRDGSIDDDTTVFTQGKFFRLVSDHHIQRGPSFPHPIDILIDVKRGLVTSRTKDGKLRSDEMKFPEDLANGLPPNLLMNLDPSTPETKVSFLAPTEKPRLVEISIKPRGEVQFLLGGVRRKAVDYTLHVELGGLTGVIAPLIGKQPSDFHIWILPGASPAFIRERGSLYEGGPEWIVQQISPSFVSSPSHDADQ